MVQSIRYVQPFELLKAVVVAQWVFHRQQRGGLSPLHHRFLFTPPLECISIPPSFPPHSRISIHSPPYMVLTPIGSRSVCQQLGNIPGRDWNQHHAQEQLKMVGIVPSPHHIFHQNGSPACYFGFTLMWSNQIHRSTGCSSPESQKQLARWAKASWKPISLACCGSIWEYLWKSYWGIIQIIQDVLENLFKCHVIKKSGTSYQT